MLRTWRRTSVLLSEAAEVLSKDKRQTLGSKEKRTLYKHGKTQWSPQEALQHVRNSTWSKIDETLECVFHLNIDPRHAEQNLRGAVDLPFGIGKAIKVGVFARGDKADEAVRAGAEVVGAEELVEKLKKTKPEFDRGVATPDMMSLVGRVGKVLGPKKLMPTPKTGTVTFEIDDIVRRIREGRHVQFRTDPRGYIAMPLGKLSSSDEALIANLRAAFKKLLEMKPSTTKKKYLLGAVMSSSMGPGVHLSLDKLNAPSVSKVSS